MPTRKTNARTTKEYIKKRLPGEKKINDEKNLRIKYVI
jgi:hypothetical protein